MSLTHDDVKRIAEGVLRVDPNTHLEDHRWAKSKRDEEEEARAIRKRLLTSSLINVMWISLGFTVVALWHEVVARIGALLK